MLPAQASFVDGGASKKVSVPFRAIKAWRLGAVSESGVEVGQLRRAGAVVVLLGVCLVDQAHVDTLTHCEVVGLP